jgi:hypothetical protein
VMGGLAMVALESSIASPVFVSALLESTRRTVYQTSQDTPDASTPPILGGCAYVNNLSW